MKSWILGILIVFALFFGYRYAEKLNGKAVDKALTKLREEHAAKEQSWAEQLAAAQKNNPPPKSPTIANRPVAPAVVVTSSYGLAPEQVFSNLLNLASIPAFGKSSLAQKCQLISQLEELIAAGQASIPSIKAFLQLQQDYPLPEIRSDNETVLAGSLRLALFDALRHIGTPEAADLLSQTMQVTASSREVAVLSSSLEQLAPGQYKHLAAAAAREILSSSPNAEKKGREQLYAMLSNLGDASMVPAAQAELVRQDGRIDEAALRYLERSLGDNAVLVAHQALADPRLTDPRAKEPLVKLVAGKVGNSVQAMEAFGKIVNDETLPTNLRSEAIRELRHEGFNEDKPTDRDLQVIEQRIKVLELLSGSTTDPKLSKEMEKSYGTLAAILSRENLRKLRPAAKP